VKRQIVRLLLMLGLLPVALHELSWLVRIAEFLLIEVRHEAAALWHALEAFVRALLP
jgi:hypothetical protein